MFSLDSKLKGKQHGMPVIWISQAHSCHGLLDEPLLEALCVFCLHTALYMPLYGNHWVRL